MSSRNSPDMLFRLIDFGKDPATLDADAPHPTRFTSPPTLSMTADALGLTLDDFAFSREYALTRNRITIPAGTMEKGTVGAMRMEIRASHRGRVVIRRRSTWYLTRDIDADWDLRETGWHYRLDGDVPLDVMIRIPVSDEMYPLISPGLTAHPVVNAIPNVVRAAPGIRHLSEIGPVIAYFGA
jgi:4-hydroxy-tetrahydrodipicolinate reductase